MPLKYLFALLFPLILSAALSYLLNQYSSLYNSHLAWSLLFFMLLCGASNLLYYFLRRSEEFTGLLLAGIVVRLLLSLTALVVHSLMFPALFFAFAMHFIAHYILFTIFEIRFLSYLIKSKEKT